MISFFVFVTMKTLKIVNGTFSTKQVWTEPTMTLQEQMKCGCERQETTRVFYTICCFTFAPGLRYETSVICWAVTCISGTPSTTVNRINVWIPGMGVLYKFNDDYNVLLTSIHKGFYLLVQSRKVLRSGPRIGFRFSRYRRNHRVTTASTFRGQILCQVECWERGFIQCRSPL
jgi:hypothetical protein